MEKRITGTPQVKQDLATWQDIPLDKTYPLGRATIFLETRIHCEDYSRFC